MYQLKKYDELIKFERGLQIQQASFDEVYEGKWDGILNVLEHHPVYTVGRGGGWENLLCTDEYLSSQGIDVVEINRGGNITFHGPGQIVAYPIFNLSKLKFDAHWYVNSLEQVVINVLHEYGIEGSRKPDYRGAWIGDEKVCAVGVHLKKRITSHGLAFNINVDKKYYDLINPCGITEFGITSLEDHVQRIDMNGIKEKLVKNFEKVFDIKFEV